jgi:hypothetical protein
MSLTPVIADSVCEYVTVSVKASRWNAPIDRREPFKTMFGILIPVHNR